MKERMGGGRTAVTSLTVQAKLWPTPTGHDAKGTQDGDRNSDMLPNAVLSWPTPRAHDSKGNDTPSAHPQSGGPGLWMAVSLWPTPQAHDAKGLPGNDEFNRANLVRTAFHQDPDSLTRGSNGRTKVDLNPRFVESLMGLPQGWGTPSISLETDSYLGWLRAHSLNC